MSETEIPQGETLAAHDAPVVHPKATPIESRFLFVDVSALRAKQLRRGARVRIEPAADELPAHKLIKPERVAMEEVKQDLVQWSLPDFKVVVDLR
ncbi:MAG: DNA-directed RNA polymerase subunit omega [Vicinamibacterales bacterium]